MARLIRCDRCYKEIPRILYSRKYTIVHVSPPKTSGDETSGYDLCKRCSVKLERWLEGD